MYFLQHYPKKRWARISLIKQMNVKLSSVQDVLRGERTTTKIDKEIMTSVKV